MTTATRPSHVEERARELIHEHRVQRPCELGH